MTVALLERAAAALGPLVDDVVFVGGATLGVWITDPAAPEPPSDPRCRCRPRGHVAAATELRAHLDTPRSRARAPGDDVSCLDDRPRQFHFRDRDQREVDLVLEHRDGSVKAVEVKSAATVRERHFRGLVHLREKRGARFNAGALLYTGASSVPFGDRLAAGPLVGLWAA